MKRIDDIEDAIRNLELRVNTSRDEAILNELLQAGASAKRAAAQSVDRRERIMVFKGRLAKAAAVAAAACIAVIVVGLLIKDGPSSLYAQAIDAVRQAKTVHTQGFHIDDGKPVKQVEIWYESGRGVREWSSRKGTVQERLDNGKTQWVYRSSNKTAFKSASVDPVGVVAEILNFDKQLAKMKFVRMASEDTSINGIACQAHVAEPRSDARYVMWIDGQRRAQRFEQRKLRQTRWMTNERVDLVYDQPIPADRFEPNFGSGVKIADFATLKAVDFSKNLQGTEVLGLSLSVHEVQGLDDGSVLVVWSIRPTKETIRRLGPISSTRHGMKTYGDAQIMGVENPSGQGFMQPMSVAGWRQDGVELEWTVLIPKGKWPQPIQSLELRFGVWSRNELQNEFKQHKKPWYQDKVVLGKVELPKGSITAEQSYRMVYDQAAKLHSISLVGSVMLTGKSRPLTDQEKQQQIKAGMSPQFVEGMTTVPQHQPNEITPEQFIENVKHNYLRLRDMKY